MVVIKYTEKHGRDISFHNVSYNNIILAIGRLIKIKQLPIARLTGVFTTNDTDKQNLDYILRVLNLKVWTKDDNNADMINKEENKANEKSN